MTEKPQTEASSTDDDAGAENGRKNRASVPPPFVPPSSEAIEEGSVLNTELADEHRANETGGDDVSGDASDDASDEEQVVTTDDESLGEADEIVFDDAQDMLDEGEILVDDEEVLFADDEVFFEELGDDLLADDEQDVVFGSDDVVSGEDQSLEYQDEFERPTDEHEIVIDDEGKSAYSREVSDVTNEHAIVVEEEFALLDDDEVVSIGGDGFDEDDMIDFQEAPTGQRSADRSATQEVAPLDQNLFDDEENIEPFQDATVEISERELYDSPSFSDAQRAAAEARQHRIDEVRRRRDSGGSPMVPLHTPAATISRSGSHPSANGHRRHTSDMSGSHTAAMSSPHADLDKQLRWLLALLVIALIAALITLAVLLGAFEGNSETSNDQATSSIERHEEFSFQTSRAYSDQFASRLLTVIDRGA